jgi:glycosyltransferase involved in cell wall biosynthesis
MSWMIWIDVTDIYRFLHTVSSVNGIQRAVLNAIDEMLRRSSECRLVVFDERIRAFREVSPEEIRNAAPILPARNSRVVRFLLPVVPPVIRAALRSALERMMHRGRPRDMAPFTAGDTFYLMGAFWHDRRHAGRVTDTVSRSGMRFVLFIHDLIPLTHRHWFRPAYVAMWQSQFDELSRLAGEIVVNSKSTRASVESYLSHRAMPSRKVSVVRFGDPVMNLALSDTAKQRFDDKRLGKYVLMVSAIDARKNQKSLILVWERLMAEFGERTPRLILVGKDGTASDTIHGLLNDRPELQEKVLIDQQADDERLVEYYRHCMFTVFPSFMEGWGFPVAESLMVNKACIASRLPSIVEVGNDLCRYVDPHDLDDIHSAVRDFLVGPTRASYERRISKQFKRHGWGDTAEEILAILKQGSPNALSSN